MAILRGRGAPGWLGVLMLLGAPAAVAGTCETKFKVVVRGGSPTLRYAAEELRDYGRKLFGADWSGQAEGAGFTSLITIASDELGIERPSPLAGDDAYDIS